MAALHIADLPEPLCRALELRAAAAQKTVSEIATEVLYSALCSPSSSDKPSLRELFLQRNSGKALPSGIVAEFLRERRESD